MKNAVKTNVKKQKLKKKLLKVKTKNKKEKVLIVAQEIKFARLLSGNDKKTRDRVLKSLKKWLESCFAKDYEFKEDDFIRVWKGLFYAVWMSDKPLIQEELCESISSILDVFPARRLGSALLMARAGWRVLATEWFGIDQHRMDKYLMLVRRYLRGSLRCLQRDAWRLEACQMFADMLTTKDGILSVNTPLYARNATSMILHVVDCFLEELNKLCKGTLPEDSFVCLVRPFCAYMCAGAADSARAACRRVLTCLVRDSVLGIQYRDKLNAWQTMGCPVGGPDALELVTNDDDDGSDGDDGSHGDGDVHSDDDAPLDPRAGRVDVSLHPWRVPARALADLLRDMLGTARAQRPARLCMQRFEKLAEGEYPLGISSSLTEDAVVVKEKSHPIRSLRVLDHKLTDDADELALRGLSRKHRKRLLAKARAGLDIVEEAKMLHATSNGTWQVEDTESAEKIPDDKDNNKENLKKKTNNKDKKLSTQIIDKKVSTQSIDKKKPTQSIHKKVSTQSIDKKVSTQSIDKKVSTQSIDKKPAQSIEKNDKLNANKQDKKRKHEERKPEKHNKKQKVLEIKDTKQEKETPKKRDAPKLNYQKQTVAKPKSPIREEKKSSLNTPKRVKFVLKNNSMQQPLDYYKSVRQSPNIPFDSDRAPSKTNLKVSTPSPINPFFKKKLRMKK